MSTEACPSCESATDQREKWVVAVASVASAGFLTATKIGVGLVTGSLGILAEAAHSGLDLLAAAVTCFAVRYAGKPADQEHTYGHGKIENFSALFETLLLVVTCVWIAYEAIHSLRAGGAPPEANLWGFGVMVLSIVVNTYNARRLRAAAEKFSSQALEADGLHFTTDIWSSWVVMGGLALVWVSDRLGPGYEWLAKGDAVAALGVAAIVLGVSWSLGRKSVADLLDAVPSSLCEQMTQAARVAGVVDVRHVRVRRSGPELFADMHVKVAPGLTVERAHEIAHEVEAAVKRLVPSSSVLVHVEPAKPAPAPQG